MAGIQNIYLYKYVLHRFIFVYFTLTVEQTINICEVSEVTAQSGYISSPSYPLNYNKPYQCQISIDLRTKQKIRLVIVDMNLHENESGKGCTDYLYIRNELRSVTVCGQRGSEELFDSSGKIDIRFAAEAGGDNKGFWLYYEGTLLILDCLLLTLEQFLQGDVGCTSYKTTKK